ncbi:hypothetical protein scyTo_0016218 [Scyliorhinus torazame]|uniref:Uncharacterized protein n=1 Tax=Scyliorhinus torazame TaxID=75743 RepID=A0A401Q544_SCYTO|nr:hypothetical protein [Scyliorhinus torazame]
MLHIGSRAEQEKSGSAVWEAKWYFVSASREESRVQYGKREESGVQSEKMSVVLSCDWCAHSPQERKFPLNHV